ncbi:MAG: hypothetical protein E6J90_03105 [Deltaproteobacteria bacterium]|nr:MAG: hypothetical protein E6J91_16540 [Deltaproteobacteria bacterium]TMQ27149.1 MAG: hypothetical protein E6J90_03105 [Deltaproteobacteria bacterium]
MTDAQQAQLEHILSSVEHRIRHRPDRGVLDPETVLALDIVQHALSFTKHAEALALFREVLWQRRVADSTRVAVRQMMEHIMESMNRGALDAASKICNCLHAVTDPDIFRGGLTDQLYRAMAPH